MSVITSLCVHLHANHAQASCLIPTPDDRASEHACMSCAIERIEEWIEAGDSPKSIPPRVSFFGCVHRPGKHCVICYTSLIGLLMALWGYTLSARRKRTRGLGSSPIVETIKYFLRARGTPSIINRFFDSTIADLKGETR
jgi:hypothetical protein